MNRLIATLSALLVLAGLPGCASARPLVDLQEQGGKSGDQAVHGGAPGLGRPGNARADGSGLGLWNDLFRPETAAPGVLPAIPV